jgi:hypothetical protein
MSATNVFRLVANQNSGWTMFGRVCSRNGSGTESPVPAEGFLVIPSDLSVVQVNVYDQMSSTPGTPIYTANPTPSSVISSTLQTGNVWTAIVGGGNFSFTFPANVFVLPAHDYLIVILFTTSGGETFSGQAYLKTQRVGP